MQALYIVELEDDEKNNLKELLRGGSLKVRQVKRAQILLAADQGHTDKEISELVDAGTATVFRTRRKYVEGGLEPALIQLIGETRVPLVAKKGKPRRIDYEYKRNGTANLFVTVDRHAGTRKVNVTDHRTKIDFARQMRELVDVDYPQTELVRVVLDNLNTHTEAALYEAFEPAEARRLLRKIEFHFTPKHASWLNMVEIEIGVLSKQCLDRRIPDKETLTREVAAWERQRNDDGATIRWMFTVDKAREKMGAAYPSKPL